MSDVDDETMTFIARDEFPNQLPNRRNRRPTKNNRPELTEGCFRQINYVLTMLQ